MIYNGWQICCLIIVEYYRSFNLNGLSYSIIYYYECFIFNYIDNQASVDHDWLKIGSWLVEAWSLDIMLRYPGIPQETGWFSSIKDSNDGLQTPKESSTNSGQLLVGGWAIPLQNIRVSWGYNSQYMESQSKFHGSWHHQPDFFS